MTPAPAPAPASARAPLKPLDLALAELLAQAVQLNGVESISTFDADGRVLAEDLRSALHVPPQDNSSMDGYAMRCADVPTAGAVLSVSQRIPAGSAALTLQAGTAARIFTGAAIPAGAGRQHLPPYGVGACALLQRATGDGQTDPRRPGRAGLLRF